MLSGNNEAYHIYYQDSGLWAQTQNTRINRHKRNNNISEIVYPVQILDIQYGIRNNKCNF